MTPPSSLSTGGDGASGPSAGGIPLPQMRVSAPVPSDASLMKGSPLPTRHT
jgi:hypothetical protein